MKDEDKTKEQLVNELLELRQRITELEKAETERKRAEEALRESEDQLRQAQKMEAIGTLAGGIAHDFNNILTVIQGNAQLGLMGIQEDNPLYQRLDEIQKASKHAANLTGQMLLFSRRHPTKRISLNLNTTIKDMKEMLNRLVSEDISVTNALTDSLWSVNADPGNIEQLIMNLVVNARDAVPEGGKISIKTENVQVDDKYCKIYSYARPGRFVCLAIQDAGVGMDQATIDRIFEPFFSTKKAGEGTGLGLSVVYGIVKQHEGWINVESSPGEGAIFRIYLPVVSSTPGKEQKGTVPLEALKGKGQRILLVEDEEPVRELSASVLSQNGYRVFAAASVQEALDIFEKERGSFDLIFCDVGLPDGKGSKLVEQLLRLKPGISVLFTSGYTKEKSDWQIIQERGYPYLQKPYSLPDLLGLVSEVLKKK